MAMGCLWLIMKSTKAKMPISITYQADTIILQPVKNPLCGTYSYLQLKLYAYSLWLVA